MHARVVRELGMEGSDQEAALPEENRLSVELGEHLDVGRGARDAGRPDEHAAERLVLAGQLEIGFEAEDLTAVPVARDLDVDEAEVVAVEHDQARTRAEDRLLEPPDRVFEPVEPHQAHERRRLTARDDEPVEPVELLRLADLDRLCAEPTQHRRVLAEVPLECQDADLHATNSRFRRSGAGTGARSRARER